MDKKRGRLEIIYDILNVINKNQNRIKYTPLLRKSNLSTKRFSEYVSELLEKEFIKALENKKDKYFCLTDKGFHYLEKYKNITTFVEDFGL
ncbi:MAG: winged helix-turn-helix domain-containing protein [Candidatus Nanoarchaeia archaeon]|jgi:predicted transcriptional regulator|nr:winged helix-turn-helix domain-containing protein [Candidatus Nanoarchaeia archaeon]